MNIPNCRFCSADASYQTIKGHNVYEGKPGQHFWKCDLCQIIYLYPPLSKEEEQLFYKKEFEKFMEKRSAKDKDWSSPEKHFQSNKKEALRRFSFLKNYLQTGDSILEVGCSSGFMLTQLKEKGLQVYGVEPSEIFIDYTRAKGIPVFKDFEKLKENENGRFDLIIHYYVLEHSREPVAFIQDYMNLLSEKGKMIFEVPSATDPLIELYKVPAFENFYWSIAHHWYFNQASLRKVLEKTGFSFEIFPEQRYDLSNHITWMLKGEPGGIEYYTDIFGDELDDIYKLKLKQSWLCDTIIAVINK